jgi:transcriptional regulator with XRE-family HTH domain
MVRKSSDSLRTVLAKNIKTFRKEKGISQEELAELCGLHRTYIGSVERHERNVTLSTLEVLASTFGVTVPELLTRHESPSNNEPMGKLQ